MNKTTTFRAAALLVLASAFAGTAFAADAKGAPPATVAAPAPTITKEQAVEMALKAHPGDVTKVYEDTKKGKKTWEVKINGSDGKKWEVHYEISTGALVAADSK